MVTDDYVSLELAKLLKKKGFDQNCAHYYLDGTMYRHHPTEVLPIGKETFAAPTLAQVMKWLREAHSIFIEFILNQDVKDEHSVIENYYHFNLGGSDFFCNFVARIVKNQVTT